jgi:hypothetical protein
MIRHLPDARMSDPFYFWLFDATLDFPCDIRDEDASAVLTAGYEL